jgi:predicted DNA-binding transcriptional regulator YafY
VEKLLFKDSQIVEALKHAEAGVTIPELCGELGVSSSTFYNMVSSTSLYLVSNQQQTVAY